MINNDLDGSLQTVFCVTEEDLIEIMDSNSALSPYEKEINEYITVRSFFKKSLLNNLYNFTDSDALIIRY